MKQEFHLRPPLQTSTTELSLKVGDETYSYNAEAFFQVNPGVLIELLEFALDDVSGEVALDLYCGVGLFTLPLARRFRKVIGIEANSAATRFARRNLQQANLPNGNIVTSTLTDWIDQVPTSETLLILFCSTHLAPVQSRR